MSRTDATLGRLLSLHPKLIDLGLDRVLRLLEAMGRPQDRLPPVIHVAGTNGKGSTIAFLRAFLEAAGKRVHVYNSPHLVRFNERIRLAGKLVSNAQLNRALEACEEINAGQPITFFEITTAAAFKLFAEVPADYLLLEVGLGGEFDSTNVIDHPLGVVITPVDIDHQAFLGDTLAEIAKAKAGILKRGAPAVFGRQRDGGYTVLTRQAARLGIRPLIAGEDFDAQAEDGRLVFQDGDGLLDLPPPGLPGPHQYDNAGLAIAAARHFGLPVSEMHIAEGLRRVSWPARLMPLAGKLSALLTPGTELWLDGGHNAHGAAALAKALGALQPKPLALIVGMMNTRAPEDLLAPFRDLAPTIIGVTIPGEANAHPAQRIAEGAAALGLVADAAPSIAAALRRAAKTGAGRVVICGSLYLAGQVLHRNGTPPE